MRFESCVTSGEINTDFGLQYPSSDCNSSNKTRAWKNKHLGLMKVMHLSQGKGRSVELSVLREKHVNTKSFHQSLMDVLIFSGQQGSPWQHTVITYLKGSWLFKMDCSINL